MNKYNLITNGNIFSLISYSPPAAGFLSPTETVIATGALSDHHSYAEACLLVANANVAHNLCETVEQLQEISNTSTPQSLLPQ